MCNETKDILLVAATEKELKGLQFDGFFNINIYTCVTGVGMMATGCTLTQRLEHNDYDLVLGIGICGSFNTELNIGDVVQVANDRFSELGAEDHDRFIPADQMKLVRTEDMVFYSERNVKDLRQTKGITVNRIHGNAESIRKTVEQFNPDVESMEGAALGFVCEPIGIPWVQIRAISNKVEPRNRDNWNIPLALKNLHIEVLNYLKQLDNEA